MFPGCEGLSVMGWSWIFLQLSKPLGPTGLELLGSGASSHARVPRRAQTPRVKVVWD